jgi:hypothetical protein
MSALVNNHSILLYVHTTLATFPRIAPPTGSCKMIFLRKEVELT